MDEGYYCVVCSKFIKAVDGVNMTCKHRWEPSNFGINYRTPNSYWYCCARCGATIFTFLKDAK